MRTRVTVLAVALAVLCLGLARAGDAKKDRTLLKGTWIGEHNDKKITLQFAAGKFTIEIGEEGDVVTGSFKLHPDKKPKAIDFKIEKGKKHRGKSALGIYELSGTTLKLCLNGPGREQRPEQLAGDGGEIVLITFERKKD